MLKFQSGQRGSGMEGLAAPPCGQLMCCFSAVAELLVTTSSGMAVVKNIVLTESNEI